MSGVYFHTPSGTEQVSGAERAHMGWLAMHLGKAALINVLDGLDVPPLNPNNERLRWYQDVPLRQRLDGILGHSLFDDSRGLIRDGQPVSHGDVMANTALLLGSDVIRLAVRIDGQCELHGFVDGEDRAWLADLIAEGCDTNVFRRGFSVRHADTGGWDAVIALLRARDDEPVVLSYSGSEGWPDMECTTWTPPNTGREWETEEDEDRAADEDLAAWEAIGEVEQWRTGMEWLRASPRLLRFDPNHWGSYRFGNCLTAFDFAPKTRPSDAEQLREVR